LRSQQGAHALQSCRGLARHGVHQAHLVFVEGADLLCCHHQQAGYLSCLGAKERHLEGRAVVNDRRAPTVGRHLVRQHAPRKDEGHLEHGAQFRQGRGRLLGRRAMQVVNLDARRVYRLVANAAIVGDQAVDELTLAASSQLARCSDIDVASLARHDQHAGNIVGHYASGVL